MSKPGQFDDSIHASSPEPDPEGAKVLMRDAAGNLVETRPKHHVDAFAKTEAVAGSVAPAPTGESAKPQTFLERLRDCSKQNYDVTVYTAGGHQFIGRLMEVTDEVLVLKQKRDELGTTILLYKVDAFLPCA